jgi:hypothetical protein
MSQGLFGGFPIWAVFVATIVAFVAAMKAGHLIGARSRARLGEVATPDLGATLGGLLGLLGLLLAFTFGMAGERFDRRKTLVVEEANAIGTAWLRTDLIPEPQRALARDALRAYTQARLDVAKASTRDEAITRSEKIQADLWTITAAAAAASPTPTVALFVAAVNEVIDMHGRRVQAALRNPIPPTIFATLYAVAILVLGIAGYARGVTGDRSATVNLVLALVLAVVFALIMDLDRPYEGLLTVSQQAMRDLLGTMQPPAR